MALMNLGEVLAKLEGDDQVEFLRFVGISIGISKETIDATEKAAELAAKITAKLKQHQLLDDDVVKKYNEAIKKAFRDEHKEGKESSQDDKSDD